MAEVAPTVDALVDAQLLIEDDANGAVRYRLHDLVRLYARERAVGSPSAEARHHDIIAGGLGAWLAVAERMSIDVPGPCFAAIHGPAARTDVDWSAPGLSGIEPITWFDREHVRLEEATRQACRVGLDEHAYGLAACLEKYFDVRGLYAQWRGLNEQVAQACRRAGNTLGEAVMLRGLIDVRTWHDTASSDVAMGRLAADATQLELMFAQVDHVAGMSDAAVQCAWGLGAQGDLAGARTAAERALYLARRADHIGGQARAYVAIALVHREAQELSSAVAALETALGLARTLGEPPLRGHRAAVPGHRRERAGPL